MFSIWLRVRANLYGIRYVFISCVWNPLRLRKNGYVFIKYHKITVRSTSSLKYPKIKAYSLKKLKEYTNLKNLG